MGKYFEGEFSTLELMSCLVSRELRPDDKVIGPGLYNEFVFGGALLAQRTHCPDLLFAINPGWISFTEGRLPRFTRIDWPLDYRYITHSEFIVKGHDLLQMPQAGPRPSITVFFLGGMQLYKYGNANTSYIGDWRKPKFVGPGIMGMQLFSSLMRRYYLYARRHTTRQFVEEVDFITAAGYKNKYGERKDWGLDKWNLGPEKVFSPIAIMDFDEETKIMRLKSVHPGHTVEEVKTNTGFDIIIPEKVPTTELPFEEEIRILRQEIDPTGLLRREWKG